MDNLLLECRQQYPDSELDALECIANHIQSGMDSSKSQIETIDSSLKALSLIFTSILMFTMQAGFAMLCAGSVRTKNVPNTLLKNFLDACGAGVAYYVIGYALAFGDSPSGIIQQDEINGEHTLTFAGSEHFFLIDFDNYGFWFYQFAFAACCATIVAGTLAERSQMVAYFANAIMLTGFVFPVVCHAVWSIHGFLNPFRKNPLFGSGMVDIAGAGVVHVTGGMTALIATVILGPRKGRFHDEDGNFLRASRRMKAHSPSLQVLGTFLLWIGWYGFNVGSVYFLPTAKDISSVASLALVTTTLGATGGAITSLGVSVWWNQRQTGEPDYDIVNALNGCLSGLVAITAGASIVEPWAALLIGSFAGIFYLIGSSLLTKLHIDDAVDAIPVHLVNGIWGVIAVGLFASPKRVMAVLQRDDHVGWFYSWGRSSSDASLLATNVLGVLCIILFVVVVMTPFFIILHYVGLFRSDELEDIIGLPFTSEYDEQRKHVKLPNGKTSGEPLRRASEKRRSGSEFSVSAFVETDDLSNHDVTTVSTRTWENSCRTV
ncbi:unnamed protein product [Cylindrotheca closterium]|uniref:Ammonium transporter AmtB-like domain-containing protein n=1 Tax=Cylindrotheca closterium TaxID=2856 RepID=A0AAD2JIX7_9STRA|nr:unnamed protein product [Cylindrotheca closterium]